MKKEFKIIDENGEIKIFKNLNELNKYYSPAPKKEKKKVKSVGNGNGSLYYSQCKKKWMFAYFDPTKKRKVIAQRIGETKTDFDKRVIEIKASLNNGTYLMPSNATFRTILKEHIDQKWKDGKIRPVTRKRNLDTFNEIEKCCENFFDVPIQKVTINMINDSKPKMRQYANSTIDKIWALMLISFKIAHSRHITQYNITDDVSLVKPVSVKPTKRVYPLTVKEEEKFREVLNNGLENPMYCNICLLQLNTGMRIGEVLALKLDDIDLKEKTIHVHSTITVNDKNVPIFQSYTKTYDNLKNFDYGIRKIPMSDEVYSLIKKIIQSMSLNIEKFLFYNNGYISRYKINPWLSRINYKYRIIDPEAHPNDNTLHSHILRHTFATRMAENGIPEQVQQAILGHVPRKLRY